MQVPTIVTRTRRLSIGLALCALLGAGACNKTATSTGSELPAGSVQDLPGSSGLKFIVDPNSNGGASNLRLLRTEWGRLVDVFAADPLTGQPRRYFADFLISSDIASDNVDYRLERLPGTGREILTILHTYGTAEYDAAFAALDDSLQFFIVKGVSINELPPFTAAPRNSAVRLVFDDLLDPATITDESIDLRVGYPPESVQGARIIPDQNYGDLVGSSFRSTRVIVDLTVSQDEATALNLTVNSLGLPEAQTPNQANAVLRLATRPVAGQIGVVLANTGGSPLSFNGNGATDATAPSLDIVRAFRSGGRTSVTQDPNNGFLPDDAPPRIMSSQQITIQGVVPVDDQYFVDVVFQSIPCAMTPRAGDLVVLANGIYLRVLTDGVPPSGGVASAVLVELIDQVFPGVSVSDGAGGQYRQPWLASDDQDTRPECWVTVLPTPALAPNQGLATNSTFTVQFSEPMDPARISGFDTLKLRYGVAPSVLQAQVVGSVTGSGDLTRFTFQPRLPLRHATGGAESFLFNVVGDVAGVSDFAGNTMSIPFLDSLNNDPDFTLATGSAPIESRSISLNFSATDEDPDPTGAIPARHEFRGQLIYDLLNSRIRPRSVARLTGTVEPQSPTTTMASLMPGPDVAARPPILTATGGIIGISMNPLTRYGARTMTVWRHADLGFNVAVDWNLPVQSFDDPTFNLDVEGLWWSPSAAGVLVDNFPQFEMRLSHSLHLPDELLAMGVPVHPDSSVSDIFADNLLDPVNDPQVIVHPKGAGYTVNPVDQTQTLNGTVIAPWPMNRNVAPEQFKYYTWRDTALTATGQPLNGPTPGQGLLLGNEQILLGVAPPAPIYTSGNVPTIGLPLLMDFRCYANTGSTQSNVPNGRCAVPVIVDMYQQNIFGLETAPFFTAYSGGSVTLGGVQQLIDPDQTIVAAGTNPPGGVNSLPRNQIMLFGQGDFVVRVNRIHSRWFECAPGVAGASFRFEEPVIEPSLADLPAGTQILLSYRGATGITAATPGQTPWLAAQNLDPYGNFSPLLNVTPGSGYTVSFLNSDPEWKDSMSDIDGSFFFQTRITMISNAISGATPEMSSLGFAYYR